VGKHGTMVENHHKTDGSSFGRLMLTSMSRDRLRQRQIDPLVDPVFLRGGTTQIRTWWEQERLVGAMSNVPRESHQEFVGCAGNHSRFHEVNAQPPPQPRARTPDICWTCGQQGCRNWYASPRDSSPSDEPKFGKRVRDSAFGQPRSDTTSPRHLELDDEGIAYVPTFTDRDPGKISWVWNLSDINSTFLLPFHE